MGKIPRSIKREDVIGYVICSFGLLPYVDNNDKELLLLETKKYEKAIEEGRIKQKPSRLPVYNGVTEEERVAYDLIANHALKNIDLFLRKEYGLLEGLISNGVLSRRFFGLLSRKTISAKKINRLLKKLDI